MQQRAAAELEHAAAKEAGEAEAAARWQGRVTDLRKQVGRCSCKPIGKGPAGLLGCYLCISLRLMSLNLPA